MTSGVTSPSTRTLIVTCATSVTPESAVSRMSYVPVAFGSKANGGSLKNESRHEFCATLLPATSGA
jgi:hypothetical protein